MPFYLQQQLKLKNDVEFEKETIESINVIGASAAFENAVEQIGNLVSP